MKWNVRSKVEKTGWFWYRKRRLDCLYLIHGRRYDRKKWQGRRDEGKKIKTKVRKVGGQEKIRIRVGGEKILWSIKYINISVPSCDARIGKCERETRTRIGGDGKGCFQQKKRTKGTWRLLCCAPYNGVLLQVSPPFRHLPVQKHSFTVSVNFRRDRLLHIDVILVSFFSEDIQPSFWNVCGYCFYLILIIYIVLFLPPSIPFIVVPRWITVPFISFSYFKLMGLCGGLDFAIARPPLFVNYRTRALSFPVYLSIYLPSFLGYISLFLFPPPTLFIPGICRTPPSLHPFFMCPVSHISLPKPSDNSVFSPLPLTSLSFLTDFYFTTVPSICIRGWRRREKNYFITWKADLNFILQSFF